MTDPIPISSPLSFCIAGKRREFVYPDSGNMRTHVLANLTGQTYPLAPLGKAYRPATVVDVGANVGSSALWFLRANPEARVVCFEPSPSNFQLLQANLAGLATVECYCCGLYNHRQISALYTGAGQCMQHSIVPSAETSARTETIELRSAALEFERLGLDRVSILKIDTEGCEVPILEDLDSRLDRIDQIYVEYHSEEDRIAIERLLLNRFILSFAQAPCVHRGVNLYVSRTLAEFLPQWEAMRIGPKRR